MSGKLTHGADVEQLDDIAVGLRRQSEKIADIGGRGAAQLEKLRALWEGPDFERFASDWRRAHRTIEEADSAIRRYSRKLAFEADQQRESSGEPGGTGHSSQTGPVFRRADSESSFVASRGGPSAQGAFLTDTTMVVSPQVPETAVVDAAPRGAFMRVDHGAGDADADAAPSSSFAPAQVPSGEGAHVSADPAFAGQRSVAFDPRAALSGDALSGDALSSSSPVTGWLIPDVDTGAWRR